MFTCHKEVLTCPISDAPNLCLIHGWGADNSVWRDWATTYLSHFFTVHLIELPGFGASPAIEKPNNLIQDWTNALIATLPEQTHLLGWSLGGLLAQQITLQLSQTASPQPTKSIQSLIGLASTPRFTQLDGWQTAVSPALFSDFFKALGIEYAGVLKQFWRLQLHGSDNERPLIKQFTTQMKGRKLPSLKGLTQGLELLNALDFRDTLHNIQQPTLWLLGEKDPLVPATLISQLQSLQPNAQTLVIDGASHMPFFSHPQQTADAIIQFIQTCESHATL